MKYIHVVAHQSREAQNVSGNAIFFMAVVRKRFGRLINVTDYPEMTFPRANRSTL